MRAIATVLKDTASQQRLPDGVPADQVIVKQVDQETELDGRSYSLWIRRPRPRTRRSLATSRSTTVSG